SAFLKPLCVKRKMNRGRISTIMICRAGIFAALYVALTMPFGELAFGPFQIRPSEALTILPLFYAEAVPGLYVGCILANLLSQYGVYDILLGSLATLLAACCTYAVGRLFKNSVVRVLVGGIFPVLFNAFIVPAVMILGGLPVAYWYQVLSFLLTESVWVYALGFPLYYTIAALIKKNVKGSTPYTLKDLRAAEHGKKKADAADKAE
ncbi:MAG: QueT transporter family protein, partial [Clostridia bacterium]|nr:QueT transporter family protein [Clostridia bacterium]